MKFNPALKKQSLIDLDALTTGIEAGDFTQLSRAITLIESTLDYHQALASELMLRVVRHRKESLRIGITGVPGVGKSTFIESFGNYLTNLGFRVAVLAVDPSSTISGGSILGDKTRMELLAKNPKAFIRPSASGTTLGGVAKKTRESVLLCEAAGFNVILIETVGVGQSETTVHGMVDFFLLLKLAGAGDELQGIKRGIMEMADAIVINKADGDMMRQARLAKADFMRALHLFPPKSNQWTAQVMLCSALHHEGIDGVWQTIEDFLNLVKSNGFWIKKRQQQQLNWMFDYIDEQLKSKFYGHQHIKDALETTKQKILNNEMTPYQGADFLLQFVK